MNDTIIYIILISMLAVLGIFIFIAMDRKSKGYKLIVMKDFRNPSQLPKRYIAMYNPAKDEYIKLYSNIFKPTKSKILPPFSLASFSYNKNIYCLQGLSGHSYDDNIVPIHLPVIGIAAAHEYSQELSNVLVSVLDKKKVYDDLKINIGMLVEFNNKEWNVISINGRGIKLGFDKTDPILVESIDSIKSIKVKSPTLNAKEIYLNELLDAEFVMYNLGIVPTEDVNIILSNAKDAISSFNSKISEKQSSVMSLFGRYPWLIPTIMMFLVVGVTSAIVYYAGSQAASQLYNTGTAAVSSINNTAISAIDSITKTLGKP